MKLQYASFIVNADAGKPAEGHVDAHAPTPRREPDAPTSKLFANIHRNKERFSVAAVSKAFANVRTTKPR
jgi:hypothetical protein